MNCYTQCKSFFNTKSPKDLGNISRQGDCAYCLYWENGPGRPIYQYSNCQCNGLINDLTKTGTTMDVQSYEKIKDCLSKSKDCGVMYSNFTNTLPKFVITKDTVMKPCNKNEIWTANFKYQGVM